MITACLVLTALSHTVKPEVVQHLAYTDIGHYNDETYAQAVVTYSTTIASPQFVAPSEQRAPGDTRGITVRAGHIKTAYSGHVQRVIFEGRLCAG